MGIRIIPFFIEIMETITATKVKEAYWGIWGKRTVIGPTCKAIKYSNIPLLEVKSIIDRCDRYRQIVFNEGRAECDLISLVLFSQICEIWLKEHPNDPPLPVGRASAVRLKGDKDSHTLVTFFCQDGIWLFDQRFKELWLASSPRDIIFLIEM